MKIIVQEHVRKTGTSQKTDVAVKPTQTVFCLGIVFTLTLIFYCFFNMLLFKITYYFYHYYHHSHYFVNLRMCFRYGGFSKKR